jgi:tetratricopeptide (TPR) repeat protein
VSHALRGLLAWVVLAACGCQTARNVSPAVTPREQAQQLLAEGKASAAVSLLEREHRAHPDDFGIARELTQAHLRAGSGAEYLSRVLRDVEAHPSSALGHFQLGLLHFAQSAKAEGPAVAELEKARALAPDVGEIHWRLGVALVESERYADAVPVLRRAVELLPSSVGMQLPLAKALQRTGDSAGAVAALRQVVAGAPSPQELTVARALMEAMADPFAKVPQAARPRLEQAFRWLQDFDVPQQAIVGFEELLRDFPDLGIVHTLLGLAYQRLDDAGRALDELKRAAELAPLDGKNYFYMGELFLSKQRPDAAETAFARSVELHPLLDGAYFRLGDLALERADLPRARHLFERLTLLQPDAVPPRGKLALVYQQEGNWAAADRELKEILRRQPESTEFMLRLGVLHTERWTKATRAEEKQDASKQAQHWLREVLKAQPDNVLASRALEQVSGR